MTTLVQGTEFREAVLTATKSNVRLTALVPAARHYPAMQPAKVVWPFIRHGTIQELPQRRDGLDGTVYGSVALSALHVFAKASAEIPDPEAFCRSTCKEMASVIEGLERVTINSEPAMSAKVVQVEVIMDGDEAGAWHGIVQYEASA